MNNAKAIENYVRRLRALKDKVETSHQVKDLIEKENHTAIVVNSYRVDVRPEYRAHILDVIESQIAGYEREISKMENKLAVIAEILT